MNLTKDEIDVIIRALEDVDNMWGFELEEQEVYNKLTRGNE